MRFGRSSKTRFRVLCIISAMAGACLLVASLGQAAAAQSPMFLLDSEIGQSTFVYGLDQSSGQLTLLGSLDITLGEATGLAADGPDVLYVSTLLGDIIRIDLLPSYTATTLGNVGGNVTQIQINGGLLYVVDELTDELATVQISPLRKTVIGVIRVGSTLGPVLDIVGGDLTIDSAGNWYLFTNGTSKLYSLNITTAVATEIGPATWTSGRINGLAIDYGDGDKLYTSSRDLEQLLTLNPATGAVTTATNICLSCPSVYNVRAGDLAIPQPTSTSTPTQTSTASAPAMETETATATATPTPTWTPTRTTTAMRSPSVTPTATQNRTPPATLAPSATPTPTATPLITQIPGDVDGDGLLTNDDLAAVTAAVFDAAPPAMADVNGDGCVTAADLLALHCLLPPH